MKKKVVENKKVSNHVICEQITIVVTFMIILNITNTCFCYYFIDNVICRSVDTWQPYKDYNIIKPEFYEPYTSGCYVSRGLYDKDGPNIGFCAFVSSV